MFDAILGGLFGSEPESKTYSTMGPRDPYVDDFFMKIYGQGGTFDPSQQAQLFNDRMNGLWDYAYNAQPIVANVGGQSFPIMSPIRNRVSMLAGLNNAQMQRSYDPFLQMTALLEQNRRGSNQAYGSGGQQGLLGSLAPALGMWAGMGFPGLGGGGSSFGGMDMGSSWGNADSYSGWNLY